jgi:hypothetical protein
LARGLKQFIGRREIFNDECGTCIRLDRRLARSDENDRPARESAAEAIHTAYRMCGHGGAGAQPAMGNAIQLVAVYAPKHLNAARKYYDPLGVEKPNAGVEGARFFRRPAIE